MVDIRWLFSAAYMHSHGKVKGYVFSEVLTLGIVSYLFVNIN